MKLNLSAGSILMLSMRNKKLKLFIALFFTFALGVSSHFFYTTYRDNNRDTSFSLLAKRVDTNEQENLRVSFTPLRSKIIEYLSTLGEDSSKVSVYFEYLPTGTSIFINEESDAIAASLIKVPLVMSIYKLAEQGKIDLDKKVTLKSEWLDDDYGTLYQKGVGYELTINDAIRYTLTESDNTATYLLWDQYEQAKITYDYDVFNYLDVEFYVVEDSRIQIDAKAYSSVFKCLYFSCYNTKESSQEILNYLTQSTFTNRLEHLLPDDVKVAHKIGTFVDRYQSDCGIVYIPNRNYSLCIMVEGDDPIASTEIANISKRVYDFMVQQTLTKSSSLN